MAIQEHQSLHIETLLVALVYFLLSKALHIRWYVYVTFIFYTLSISLYFHWNWIITSQ